MVTKKIKIAQIGTGHDHAYDNFITLLNQPDLFEVVGYARVENESGVYFENYKDMEISLDELLSIPDLDAVTVETFDLNLVKYAQICADKGLHVFMDKPGSQSCDDFEKMLSTLKNKGKVFSIGYMYRQNLAVQQALEIVKSGKIGKVYSVEAQMSCDHKIEKREWLNAFDGGMTFFLGCHLVDLIYSIMGMPDEIIPYNMATGIFGVTSKDLGFVLFKYADGVSFLKTCSCEVGGFGRRQLVICGSLGNIEIKPIENFCFNKRDEYPEFKFPMNSFIKVDYKMDENPSFAWTNPVTMENTPMQDRYRESLRKFAEKILTNDINPDDYYREARVHRLVLASCGIDCDWKGEINL